MIRLINSEGNPIWIRPNCINTIQNHTMDIGGCVIAYHIGSSYFHLHMNEEADEAMRMINQKKRPQPIPYSDD